MQTALDIYLAKKRRKDQVMGAAKARNTISGFGSPAKRNGMIISTNTHEMLKMHFAGALACKTQLQLSTDVVVPVVVCSEKEHFGVQCFRTKIMTTNSQAKRVTHSNF